MPPPGSGAVKEGESVPDLNLECARNHASLPQSPQGLRAGWVSFGVAGAPDTGTGEPRRQGLGWAFEAQAQWEQCVGRATGHPAEESWSPICGAWCTCETPWEMDTLWEERVRVGTQACFPRIPTPVPSGLRVQQAQALARPWVVTCSSNCWSSQEFWGVPCP